MMLNKAGVSGVPNEVAMHALRRGRDVVWAAGSSPYRAPVAIRVMRPGAMHGFGIGDAAASATTTVADSITGGLSVWTSPMVAIQAIMPAITGIGTHPLTSLGVLIPPLALIGLLFSMNKKR